MEQNEKYLTKEEMLTLELNFEKQKGKSKEEMIKAKELKILAQNQQILELQMEILKLRSKDKKIELNVVTKEKDDLKENNRKFTRSITEKYELDEKWGFDPDTGKLV